MHIMRRSLIWLMGFLCATSVTLLVYLGTLQLTVLDRNAVKGWIAEGGVYKNNLVPSLIQLSSKKTQTSPLEATPSQFQIPADAQKLALERTFTPKYVQSQTEGVIDKFYDWMEGKSAQFAFSVVVTDKQDKFMTELARASEPYVAQFPPCGPKQAADTMCRPANVDPSIYSKQILADSLNDSDFFTTPLVSNTNAGKVDTLGLPSQIPQSIALIKPIMIGLVVLTLLSAGLLIWLSPIMERLNTLKRLAKRIYFGQIFTFFASLLLIAALQLGLFNFQSLFANQPAIVAKTIINVMKIAATSMAGTLALLSGVICAAGLVVWIGVLVWRRMSAHPVLESEPELEPEPEPEPAPAPEPEPTPPENENPTPTNQ